MTHAVPMDLPAARRRRPSRRCRAEVALAGRAAARRRPDRRAVEHRAAEPDGIERDAGAVSSSSGRSPRPRGGSRPARSPRRSSSRRMLGADRRARRRARRVPRGRRATARAPRRAEIDRRRAANEPLGPLAGVPIALKDVLVTRGPRDHRGLEDPRRAGSRRTTRTWSSGCARPARSSLGKVNCDEFAMGSSTENSAYQPTRNPWDPTRVPGGSSGGSVGGGRRRAVRGVARHRHRRLDPPAGGVLRRRRAQADLRPRLALGRGRVRVVARSGRPDRRARVADAALVLAGDRRARPARLDLARRAGAARSPTR